MRSWNVRREPGLGARLSPGTQPAARRCAAQATAQPQAARPQAAARPGVRLRPVSQLVEEERRKASDGFFTERGQRAWVDAMELGKSSGPELAGVLREMGISYDPARLAAALKGRELEVSARAVRITFLLGRFIASLAKDSALGQAEARTPERAAELRQILGQLGPSFVKVGQALSARPDLLPQAYLESLAVLQDRLPGFPTPTALAVMEQEFGRPVAEVFSELSPEPIAAASLGQVYKGRLRGSGEEVAVKVQRPSISENIAIDMLLLRRFMTLVDANLPSLVDYPIQPLVPLVDEFAGRLFSELDYVQEGRNAERFQELYGGIPRVRVPRIVWGGLTSRRVLTMEWIEGVKLTDAPAMAAAGLSIVDFVDVGIECSLRQLLAEDGGFFHADPHPGNLLATRDGQLAYLDFGMMSEAPAYARFAIISHVTHLVNRDYQAMCRDYYTLQFMDRSVDTSPIAPALAEFFDDVLGQSISQLNFKAIVDGLGGVLFKYPFRVPAYYALILRSLTVLEGLALSADRNYKLLAKAYPYMAKRLLTDDSPELRESFAEMVLDGGGRLRWNRIQNLVEEGSKSQDFDPGQLWLLARWLLGAQGAAVRRPLLQEAVRLIDAGVADEVRARVRGRASAGLADRLVPAQAGEAETVARARLLFDTLWQRLGPQLQGLRGSGPGGVPLPHEWRGLAERLQARLGPSAPQLQELLALPGAVEARGLLAQGLAQRATARFLKLVLGPSQPRRPQQLPAEAGAAGVAIAPGPLPQPALAPGASLSIERIPVN